MCSLAQWVFENVLLGLTGIWKCVVWPDGYWELCCLACRRMLLGEARCVSFGTVLTGGITKGVSSSRQYLPEVLQDSEVLLPKLDSTH